jgi:hypothetical protein
MVHNIGTIARDLEPAVPLPGGSVLRRGCPVRWRLLAALVLLLCPVASVRAEVPWWGSVRGFVARLFSADGCELGEVVGGRIEPGARDVVVPVRKKAWEAALGGEEAARPYIKARLAGWPVRPAVALDTLPRAERELVGQLARDTWRGLEAFTDRTNHLPVDNVRFGATPADDRVGDYTNVTSVGLHLIATVAATELGLISRPVAVERLRALLDTLDGLETYQGFFFNYYDTTSLERTSNFVSFVDSSWLTAGLMVVRTAFPELAPRCTPLIARADYRFFYDERLRRMSHGYYVHLRAHSRYHYGILYAESRLGSLIAIGKGDVPEEHWFAMARTLPAACSWQTQPPVARVREEIRGHVFHGGYYQWRGTSYVPSWGGSMFEALMPTLVVDEARWAAASLGSNDAAHVAVQQRYAREDLGYSVWGLSPASVPGGGGYGEYGARVLGMLGYPPGPITPHAAALALTVAPAAAVADLRRIAALYDIYGDYGFYDAADPRTGAVARTYLALNQAMTFIAAANYLCDHCIQARFAADPIAARALPLLAEERFFD